MTVEQQFAIAMRELRTAQAISQAALADALIAHGHVLDSTAITRVERNADGRADARSIRLGEAAAIAGVLGTTVDEMCHLGSTWRARRIASLRVELAALMNQEEVQ